MMMRRCRVLCRRTESNGEELSSLGECEHSNGSFSSPSNYAGQVQALDERPMEFLLRSGSILLAFD